MKALAWRRKPSVSIPTSFGSTPSSPCATLDFPKPADGSRSSNAGIPQNALFHLITAESIERAHFRRGVWSPPTQEQEQAWQSAMAAAFQSPKFDDYLDRVAQLNRRVVPRYGFYDPYEVESREQIDLPVHAFENSERFAKSLLQSGAGLEAKGDRKRRARQILDRGALWPVDRFPGTHRAGTLDGHHPPGHGLQATPGVFREGRQSRRKPRSSATSRQSSIPSRESTPGFSRESAFGLDDFRTQRRSGGDFGAHDPGLLRARGDCQHRS